MVAAPQHVYSFLRPGQLAVAASVADQSIELDPARAYSVRHTGRARGGKALTSAIFLGFDREAALRFGESAQRAVIEADQALTIGPHVRELHFRTATGGPVMAVEAI